MREKTVIIGLIGLMGLVGLIASAQAPQFTTQETARCGPQSDGSYVLCEVIPGFPEKFGGAGRSAITDFLGALFLYSLMIGGIVVFLRIIYGGLMYIFSGGNPSKQIDARDIIWQAIWGLALLLGSYLILNTINPDLVSLREPEAPGITQQLRAQRLVDLQGDLESANDARLASQRELADKRATLLGQIEEIDDFLKENQDPKTGEIELTEEEELRFNDIIDKRLDSEEETLGSLKKDWENELKVLDAEIALISEQVDKYQEKNTGFLNRVRGVVLGRDSVELEALSNTPSKDPQYNSEYERLLALRQRQADIVGTQGAVEVPEFERTLSGLNSEISVLSEKFRQGKTTDAEEERLAELRFQAIEASRKVETFRNRAVDRNREIYGQP